MLHIKKQSSTCFENTRQLKMSFNSSVRTLEFEFLNQTVLSILFLLMILFEQSGYFVQLGDFEFPIFCGAILILLGSVYFKSEVATMFNKINALKYRRWGKKKDKLEVIEECIILSDLMAFGLLVVFYMRADLAQMAISLAIVLLVLLQVRMSWSLTK